MQHAFHYWSRLLTIRMTHRPLHWQTARFRIDLARPRIMGIVNVTPDSFSDGGQHASAAAALRHCERLLREGAACGVCLMHMHGNPQTMQLAPMPGDPVPQVLAFLQQRAQALQAHGVQAERITLDPGIGFGKTVAQNFALLARQGELLSARLPLLIGWSRKSSLGAALAAPGQQPPPPQERISASVAAALLAVERGAAIVRVHDVAETAQALKVWAALQPAR